MAQEMITLKLRKGDQQKLNMALEGLRAKADANTPFVLAQAGHVGVAFCRITCPVITGRLMNSIGEPTKEGIFAVTRNSVTFGTAVIYALKVEKTSRKNKNYMLRGVTQAIPKMVEVLAGVIRV